MEAYAGRGSMELRARGREKKGAKTDLFEIMRDRGRDRLTSGVWQRALERGDELAVELRDEELAAGDAARVEGSEAREGREAYKDKRAPDFSKCPRRP